MSLACSDASRPARPLEADKTGSRSEMSAENDFLIFGAPAIGEEEIAEVEARLRSGWIGTGPRVARFESDFARYKGVAPAQVAAFDNNTRRVKNDQQDCRLLCDLMRANRLPEAWIAPP